MGARGLCPNGRVSSVVESHERRKESCARRSVVLEVESLLELRQPFGSEIPALQDTNELASIRGDGSITAAREQRGRRLIEERPRIITTHAGARFVAVAATALPVEVPARENERPLDVVRRLEDESVDGLVPPQEKPPQGGEIPGGAPHADRRRLAAGAAALAGPAKIVGRRPLSPALPPGHAKTDAEADERRALDRASNRSIFHSGRTDLSLSHVFEACGCDRRVGRC